MFPDLVLLGSAKTDSFSVSFYIFIFKAASYIQQELSEFDAQIAAL